MSNLELDPDLLATLRSLEEHHVEFVLVGDVANAIHDHGGFVCGVGIVPGDYGRNVDRLWHALDALNATLGIAASPDPRDWRREDLRELAPCSFETTYAEIDVDFCPTGTNGYRDLFQDADRHELAVGVQPHVASLEDLRRLGRVTAPAAQVTSTQAAVQPPVDLSPEHEPWAQGEIRASRTRTPH